jgi:CheY-like chemotaxis protein
MYQFLDVEEFSPVRVIATVAKSYLHSPTPLIRQIRGMPPEEGGGILAIALTAYASEIDQQQVLSAGFQMHLAKPIEPIALVKGVAKLMGRMGNIN